jgi:hypothetical protein
METMSGEIDFASVQIEAQKKDKKRVLQEKRDTLTYY